tara:strand:+ start:72 stop:404 length:333 start_codon:yes stop_codon:yes gene_type:complete
MPTYQYRCQTCYTEFEISQSFSEKPLVDCPEGCEKGSLKKVFSGVGIAFKGSGFYKNDSRSSPKSSKSVENKPVEKDSKTGDSKETTKPVSSSTKEKSADSPTSKTSQSD